MVVVRVPWKRSAPTYRWSGAIDKKLAALVSEYSVSVPSGVGESLVTRVDCKSSFGHSFWVSLVGAVRNLVLIGRKGTTFLLIFMHVTHDTTRGLVCSVLACTG